MRLYFKMFKSQVMLFESLCSTPSFDCALTPKRQEFILKMANPDETKPTSRQKKKKNSRSKLPIWSYLSNPNVMAHNTLAHDNEMSLNVLLRNRELSTSPQMYADLMQGHRSLINRLTCAHVLQGHSGCVNRLCWNDSGTVLASGSDDKKIILWQYPMDSTQKKTVIDTGHSLNIFGVCFVSCSADQLIASGAMDCEVRLHYAPFRRDTCKVFNFHRGRVKDVMSSAGCPHVFWTAGEDGKVFQFDVRDLPQSRGDNGNSNHQGMSKSTSSSGEIIKIGRLHRDSVRAMGMCSSPTDPTKIAIACGDQFVRLYDRRMLRVAAFPSRRRHSSANSSDEEEISPTSLYTLPIKVFSPPHLSLDSGAKKNMQQKNLNAHGTSVQFNSSGNQILCSYHGDHIYLFDINGSQNSHVMYDTGNIPFGRKLSNKFSTMDVANALNTEGDKCLSSDEYISALPMYLSAIYIVEGTLSNGSDTSSIKYLSNSNSILASLYKQCASIYLRRRWCGDTYCSMVCSKKALGIIQLNYRDFQSSSIHEEVFYLYLKSLSVQKYIKELKLQISKFQLMFPESKKEINNLIKSYSTSDTDKGDDDESKESSYMDDSDNARSSESSVNSDSQPLDSADDFFLNSKQFKRDLLCTQVVRRYIGYCNIQTDIKEAKFFGRNDAHVVSGSDDGRAIIWEKDTGKIVKTLNADLDIVNCVQSHPFDSCLATSGIEKTVRIWSPMDDTCFEDRHNENEAQLSESDHSSEDEDSCFIRLASENQRHMNDRSANFFDTFNPNIVRLLFQSSNPNEIQECTQS